MQSVFIVFGTLQRCNVPQEAGEYSKMMSFHNLYASINIVMVIKWKRTGWVGEIRNLYKILVGKSEGKRPFGRTRRGWEYNIGI